ncbi:hypothetical protein V2J09_012081 [Rumex salicifolius]
MDNGNTSPLLSREHLSDHKKSPNFFLRKSAKWVLKFLMWVVFISWVAVYAFFPAKFGQSLFEILISKTKDTVYGIAGTLLLAFSVPVLDKAKRSLRFRIWTFPVLVDGPFGVVSAAEFIGITLSVLWFIWATSVYTVQAWSLFAELEVPSSLKWSSMFEAEGIRVGQLGIFCLAFLFIPVSRGSVLLRVIDIPFEHATRYHVWLGHLTMFIFSLHGIFYIIAWAMQGRLIQQLLEWKDIGVANLAGVISLLAGLFMWVTSLHPVRKYFFEVFFYTHQLYIIFIVFLALHVGDFIFSIALGGLFLFMLDRFLRFFQSRKTVDVISATSLPCGSVELVLSKPPNLRYNALSFIFLQVRELSWLQWHPFSVSSSPMDGKHHLSVLIKVLGSWTENLKDRISSANGQHQEKLLQSQITASVEGPYGHESPYHLKYKHLVLVAGGIGISPFLAVLNDVFNRIKEGKPCLTRSILILWAIKGSDELSLLSMLNMDSVSPILLDVLDLDIQEEGGNHGIVKHSFCSTIPSSSMSGLVGTGDNLWVGLYVISSITGFFVFLWMLDAYYINPYDISSWWYKGLLLLLCMIASVVIVGGSIVMLWHLWGRTSSSSDQSKHTKDELIEQKNASDHNYINQSSTIHYGCRPDFRGMYVLGSTGERWGPVDVGVLVCGPSSLQSSVAKEIRSHNLQRRAKEPVFHFNSHSFDL